MVSVLRTRGLSKRYGTIRAVDGVDLDVEEGDCYGFLGLNGAGKTTTIRMILGLVRPDAGGVELFGSDARTNFIPNMRRTGSLVEGPAFYPYLSAARNLDVLRWAHGGVERSRIDEVLGQVGLADRAGSPVRTFSQGMRQRLAIAMALLTRPELVILDEPLNGLDPKGIQDIRTLIRSLNRDRGVTFLVSSHLLHEIEITCNRVGILREGRLEVQDRVDALLARTVHSVRIECVDPAKAAGMLRTLTYVREVSDEGDALQARVGSDDLARLNADLVRSGIAVTGFVPLRRTLEEFFFDR